jgi:hypothetical protein
VSLKPQASSLVCPSGTDAVTFEAIASGGNGSYKYTWSDASCPDTSATCTINPPDDAFCSSQTIDVTVSDTSGKCPSIPSQKKTYKKNTTLEIIDVP